MDRRGSELLYSNIEPVNQIYQENRTQMIVAWNKLHKREVFRNKGFEKVRLMR